MKKKTIKRGLKTLSAGLLLGVSSYALYQADKFDVNDFPQKEVVVCGSKVSMEDFYSRLSYTRNGWVYKNEDGKKLRVDSLSDFRSKDSLNHLAYLHAKRVDRVDTVYVKYIDNTFKRKGVGKYDKQAQDSMIVYQLGAMDSLVNMPSMGVHNWGRITVREFRADNKKLQEKVDVYNNEYNQTYDHEEWHYLNGVKGLLQAGQSYENKFVEVCMDEVSANLRQLLSQRKSYLEHGKDLRRITPRFKFYSDLIKEGKLNPEEKISSQEAEIIANGIFDAWMTDKFDLYMKKSVSRTKHILSKTNYNGALENLERHKLLMKDCFTVDGQDYYQYIAHREQEIKDRLPEKDKKQFKALLRLKHKKMTYFDKLEENRNEKGRTAYNLFMLKNKIKNMFR